MTKSLPIEVMPESLEAFYERAALRRCCAPDQSLLAGEDLFRGWRTRDQRQGLKGLWWVRAEGRTIATLTVLPRPSPCTPGDADDVDELVDDKEYSQAWVG